MVTCNPPCINANYLSQINRYASLYDQDNAVYDPNSEFLLSCLNFGRIHLREGGEMLIIYSDLAY